MWRAFIGISALIALAWLLSSDRRRFPFRTVVGGLLLQWVLALAVLRTQWGTAALNWVGGLVTVVLSATDEGTRFLFGGLVDRDGPWGFVFALKVIPPIIVFSALSSIGYHLGILQMVVGGMARVMVRVLGTSGAETLSAAGNVFLGQTEAPLLVRPYIAGMTLSELNALMVGGFATIASGVLASYVAFIAGEDPVQRIEVARRFLTASLMSAPAALLMAKVMLPERDAPATLGAVRVTVARDTRNLIHAAAVGAGDGARLAFNVMAMLLAFVALLALIDAFLQWLGGLPGLRWIAPAIGISALSLRELLGLVFAPVAWIIGADAAECRTFGSLLGLSMAGNEFLAYVKMRELMDAGQISDRTVLLATYSMCGFANFSSIAIQIGGVGAMAPERRADLARLGLRAMLGGAMASWMTGTIAGLLS